MELRLRLIVTVLASLAATAAAAGGVVDFKYSPLAQSVGVGDTVDVKIVVSSPGPDGQPWDALDAIVSYDPAFLKLTGSSQVGAGAVFFASGFLPDPDGVNTDIMDGTAIFTALAFPGGSVTAPPAPAELVVTTLKFTALASTPATAVQFLPTIGFFGKTAAYLQGALVTGDIGSVATVTIGGALCPAPGSCYVPHDTPGCSDEACCEAICSFDLTCCTVAWDVECKDLANDVCTNCGEPGAGSCAEEHAGAGCDDLSCCRTVCAVDPSCCETTWDAICAAEGCSLCAECLGDLTGDGLVDGADLGVLLANWNGSGCGDFTFDGVVNGADLGILLAAWGPCT